MNEINEYVNNETLVKLIIIWQKNHDKKTYNEIGKAILLIAANNLRRPCFSQYSYDRKIEMMSDAVWYITRKLPTYNPLIKSNPFSYFTRTVYNAFRQRIISYKEMDAKIKSISFIENVEEQSIAKSFTFREDGVNNNHNFNQEKIEFSEGAADKFITDDEIEKELKKIKKGLKGKKCKK
jgi:hypothetical protein